MLRFGASWNERSFEEEMRDGIPLIGLEEVEDGQHSRY